MRFIATALLLTSFSALACPKLEGLYMIGQAKTGEISKLRVVQSVKDGHDVYKISWSNERMVIHTADGVARTTPIFDMGFSLQTKAYCEGDVLVRELSTILDDGQVTQSITQTYVMEGKKLRFIARDREGEFKNILCK